MPRPLRIEYPDAWYHVMNRGAGKKNIFNTTEQREAFLDLLNEASQLFGIEIHAYCLMDNHYHLLIKTPRANLSRAMRHINGVYTQRFNRLEQTDGSLFRGRYKAIIVDADNYLLQVSRYIHLNPVEAKIKKVPGQYRWSSYASYLGLVKQAPWLYTKEILGMFHPRKNVAAYQCYVEEGIDDETRKFYQKIHMAVVLGAKNFKKNLLEKMNPEAVKAVKSDYKKVNELPTLQQVRQACAKYFGVTEKSLYTALRGQKNEARRMAMYVSRAWCGETLSAIAAYYQCGVYSYVGRVVKEVEAELKTNRKLKNATQVLWKMVFDN